MPSLSEQANPAVTGVFSDRGEVCTRWVLLAEVMGVDGECTLVSVGSPGMAQWDAAGMLRYAERGLR